MPKINSDIDRKTASKLLSVSMRTIDRYIRSGKLFAREERGRIWLDRNDIVNFRHIQPIQIKRSIAKPKTIDNDFYRDLYGEAKHALSDYQQKLEQATYRIGQLESQTIQPAITLKSSEHRENSFSIELLKKELSDREKEIQALKELARRERISRIIFAALTYILLILQPVFWYLLR